MTGDLFSLLSGDCRDRLAELDDDSVDAIVTDPPYELGFMGKRWDASGIAYDVAMWAECLRVVKPGGYLLAFGGTRTYHRMVCAIEDAGFDIRDSLHWVYGSGFPKSLDVSKAIDKRRHARDDIYKVTAWVRERRDAAGITNKDIDAAFGFAGMAGHWTSAKSQPSVPTLEQVPTLLNLLGVTLDDVPDDIQRLLWDLNGKKGEPGENWAKREVVGERSVPVGHAFAGPVYGGDSSAKVIGITEPATDAAVEWEGWGTALKPAHEPIVVARKPFVGTVADNVQIWGTGALNIDGCRIAATELGRWPANVLLTHTAECRNVDPANDVPVFECAPGCPVPVLDQQSGTAAGGVSSPGIGSGGIWGRGTVYAGEPVGPCYGDASGASRFFAASEWSPEFDVPFIYTAKPSRAERDDGLGHLSAKSGGECTDRNDDTAGLNSPRAGAGRTGNARNHHPTVKPVALMRYLVRLVTRRHATVLDPFAGSGTTMVAAILEERFSIGIELTDEYHPIILGRCEHAAANLQMALF